MSDITLHVMNPRGEIEPLPVYAPSSRLASIAGTTIGLYSNSKHGMDNFYEALADLIKARYPGTETRYLAGPYEITDKDLDDFASEIDGFVYAVGD
jgi:hypothetical protein